MNTASNNIDSKPAAASIPDIAIDTGSTDDQKLSQEICKLFVKAAASSRWQQPPKTNLCGACGAAVDEAEYAFHSSRCQMKV